MIINFPEAVSFIFAFSSILMKILGKYMEKTRQENLSHKNSFSSDVSSQKDEWESGFAMRMWTLPQETELLVYKFQTLCLVPINAMISCYF